MVFISNRSQGDCLVVRDIPVVLTLIAAALSAGFFAMAFGADQGGDIQTSRILFAIGVALVGLAGALLEARIYTFRRSDGTLTVRETRLFQRKITSHAFGKTAQAELVITKDDEDADFFQAFLTTGDGQTIELDRGTSFARTSARLVIAINVWLTQNPAKGAS